MSLPAVAAFVTATPTPIDDLIFWIGVAGWVIWQAVDQLSEATEPERNVNVTKETLIDPSLEVSLNGMYPIIASTGNSEVFNALRYDIWVKQDITGFIADISTAMGSVSSIITLGVVGEVSDEIQIGSINSVYDSVEHGSSVCPPGYCFHMLGDMMEEESMVMSMVPNIARAALFSTLASQINLELVELP